MTDKIPSHVREWQERSLEPIYPFVYFDVLFVFVKEGVRVVNKAVYTVIGINPKGQKDVSGFWVSETESVHF